MQIINKGDIMKKKHLLLAIIMLAVMLGVAVSIIRNNVTVQQEYAFTADSVKKCSMTKQKSVCEANLGWIFARNYEGTE